jgi:hypothetical protein
MDFFLMLQIFFDAVLLFGILFLFHFSVHQNRKKREESDALKDIQVQEIKENLQELLMTLKQLGKEVSDNIQEQVNEAESKTEKFKKAILRFQKDLTKVTKISEELNMERLRLEEKANIIEVAKSTASRVLPRVHESLRISGSEMKKTDAMWKSAAKKKSLNLGFDGSDKNIGFSSELVEKVYRLADLKAEINEIVQQTKLSRAEIQLILNLRDNRFAVPELSVAKT